MTVSVSDTAMTQSFPSYWKTTMHSIRLICAMFAGLMMATASHAVDGGYDSTWGNLGRLTVDVSPGNDIGRTLLIRPNGKMLVAGNCGDDFCAMQMLPNGSYDTGFGPALHPGRLIQGDSDGAAYYLMDAELSSGNGLVLAGMRITGASSQGIVLRADALGTTTFSRYFDANLGATYALDAIAIQSDGKIIVAAHFLQGSRVVFAISRLIPTTLDFDFSFGDANGTKMIAFVGNAAPTAVAIQPDGKIVVVGTAANQVAAVRLRSNGQLDDDPVLGFGDAGRAVYNWGVTSIATAVLIDGDGSLLLAGYAYGGTGPVASDDFFVNRLTPRGVQHPDFGLLCPPPFCDPAPAYIPIDLDPGDYNDEALALALQPDGKILLSGRARVTGGERFAVARLTPIGDPDFDFGNGGSTWSHFGTVARFDTASGIAVGNGGIMIAGYSEEAAGGNYRFGIAKLLLREVIFAGGFE
jgi:uncharacterized delta-60 repeat protein